MPSPTQKKGSVAEERAQHFLRQQGFKFIKRNYNTKSGELDLIMRDGESLVFIEVRFRDRKEHGDGVETITQVKRNKMIKAATLYLVEHNLWDKIYCRFDVVGIGSDKNDIIWIKDAFQVK